jgi:hypothetical protein
MGRRTKIKVNNYNKVGMPSEKIEFTEGQHVTYFNGKKDLYLSVERIRINPMSQTVEYLLEARTGDLPFRVVAKPNQLKQSMYFTG